MPILKDIWQRKNAGNKAYSLPPLLFPYLPHVAALPTFYIWFQTYASPSKTAGMFLYVENKISTSKRISVSNEV